MGISRRVVHQTLACSPVILNQFMLGVGFGWVAPTLVKLTKSDSAINVTSNQISWLASLNDIGKVLGTFISPLLVENIGRRYTLALATVIYFCVWFCVSFTRNIHVLLAVRIIFGVANGINDVVSVIYTTENSSPTFRGIIGSVILFTYFGAIFCEFVIATYLSYSGTAIANTVLSAVAFSTLYFGIETPYFLVMKGEREKAEKNLAWLSGNADHEEVAEELRRIEQSVSEEVIKKRSLKLLFSSKTNLWGIFMVVSMYIVGMGTGSTAIGSYASFIFSPSKTLKPNEFTILYGATKFIAAVFISPFIIEKIDRRIMVIGCFTGMTFCNVCSSLWIYLHTHGFELSDYYPWLIFSSVASYNMFFAVLAPTEYALKGELLPFSVRAIGSSIAVIGHSMAGFCVTRMFFPISQLFGMEINFLIYSVVGLLAIVFFYFLLPETRGKTLHELQHLRRSERVIMNKILDDADEECPSV